MNLENKLAPFNPTNDDVCYKINADNRKGI